MKVRRYCEPSIVSCRVSCVVWRVACRKTQVKDLLDKSYKRAWDCLQTNRRDLEKLAKALLQHESLTGSEIKDVLAGKVKIKAE